MHPPRGEHMIYGLIDYRADHYAMESASGAQNY